MRTVEVTLRSVRWSVWVGVATGVAALFAISQMGQPPGSRLLIVSKSGIWSMQLLLLTLFMTPLAEVTRRPWLKQARRVLGLAAFALGLLHVIYYLLAFRIWPDRLDLILRKPYQLAGLLALVMLLPLVGTSFNTAVRRLGLATWRRIHGCIYPIVLLVLAHELLYQQDSYRDIALQSALLAMLFVWRARRRRTANRSAAAAPETALR